ncbi:MAG TPA: metalloregulator ArsR/SmtB family transcription factor [Candidatus Dormibacteraeota bacterium]|nr:metalloregulator ArsR/SmtB family transcription factor [Candidatus Dormibacteraeota bacterium]
MPMISDGSRAGAIEVRPSAALELMWVFHDCEAGHSLEGPLSSLEGLRTERGQEFREFWDDGVRGFTELVVLAQRSGTLFDLDLERFFAELDQAALSDQPSPSLLSETPFERRALEARLRRLRTEAGVRADYKQLLRDAWDHVLPEWEALGRPAVVKAATDWRSRLDRGDSFRSLLERPRIWPGRPEIEDLADGAAAEGRLVMSPGWFYGVVHLVELDGTVLLGRRLRTSDEAVARQQISQAVAAKMRALADPTRLAILLWLASHPSSITEVARQFKLSQPTVSAHVQLLRESDLIEEKQTGRSSTLTVTERRVKDLLSVVEEALLRQFPAD